MAELGSSNDVFRQKDEEDLKLLRFHKVWRLVMDLVVSRHYEYQTLVQILKGTE